MGKVEHKKVTVKRSGKLIGFKAQFWFGSFYKGDKRLGVDSLFGEKV